MGLVIYLDILLKYLYDLFEILKQVMYLHNVYLYFICIYMQFLYKMLLHSFSTLMEYFDNSIQTQNKCKYCLKIINVFINFVIHISYNNPTVYQLFLLPF